MRKYTEHGLSGLRDEIKRTADEGRHHNARIQDAKGPERHRLRRAKAEVGWTARILFLVHALLRGIPYRALERRSKDDLVPHMRTFTVRRVAGDPQRWHPDLPGHGVVEDDVETWILGKDEASEAVA